jgi:two-component system, OmpR family, response regulator
MDVALVRWPSQGDDVERLRAADRPRLLLVEPGARPPVATTCREDWVRLPADEGDVAARVDGVRRRAVAHGDPGPVLDEHGVLRHRGRWTALPPVEARLAAALVARRGTVVSRDVLARAGWPAGAPGRNALDVHVLRLRRRLPPLGLVIRTVRSRGYLLEASETRPSSVREE